MRERGLRGLRDLSLKRQVTLTLAAVFAASVMLFLLVVVPFLREQRSRLLEQEKRLLSTLRDNYERRFIHDLLSRNAESLAADLADLASQSGVLWVEIQAEGVRLSATAEPALILRLIELTGELPQPAVLVVAADGRAELVGAGGRPLLAGRQVRRERLPPWRPVSPTVEAVETDWETETALSFATELRAAAQSFGQLHILYSLANVRRSEYLTHGAFYGILGTSFLALLVLLNLLISRIVIGPVRRVLGAMQQASTGALEVRLPVHSRDEIGTIAESFNRMVEELGASKREVEDYSRNLEAMVEERTRALRESEASLLAVKNHLATVIAHVATGVLSLDGQGRVTTFNERAGEILAVPPATAEGRPLEQVLYRSEDQRLLEFIAPVREGRTGSRKGQVSCRLPQGLRTLSVVASRLGGAGLGLPGTVVVIDDLTQLLASQRLETWKQAVEKVIHEIKNPLTPVGLAAQTLRTAHAQDPKRFDEIFPSATEMILGAVKDLKDLISEFTRFSRLPKVQLRRLDLNELVREALAPYEQGAIEGIAVRRRLGEGLPEVEADPDQLKRVLLNVVNNAIEAMHDKGGELAVTTEGPDVAGNLTVSIRDQGAGVEDPERIFEPHYTTKVKGTGLGLAIARQIVEEHGGEIRVESRLGAGTTVAIVLPAATRGGGEPRPT